MDSTRKKKKRENWREKGMNWKGRNRYQNRNREKQRGVESREQQRNVERSREQSDVERMREKQREGERMRRDKY